MTSYSDIYKSSDGHLLAKIGAFVKHHRLEQNLSQSNLAESAGISRSTLSDFEQNGRGNTLTLVQVLRALGKLDLLAHFEVKHELSPMMLAEAQAKYRKRASSKKGNEPQEPSW